MFTSDHRITLEDLIESVDEEEMFLIYQEIMQTMTVLNEEWKDVIMVGDALHHHHHGVEVPLNPLREFLHGDALDFICTLLPPGPISFTVSTYRKCNYCLLH